MDGNKVTECMPGVSSLLFWSQSILLASPRGSGCHHFSKFFRRVSKSEQVSAYICISIYLPTIYAFSTNGSTHLYSPFVGEHCGLTQIRPESRTIYFSGSLSTDVESRLRLQASLRCTAWHTAVCTRSSVLTHAWSAKRLMLHHLLNGPHFPPL